MCHTKSNTVSFYFVDQLSRNSRTRSKVPTKVIGKDIETTPDKRTKLLYSKYYRDKIFIYNLDEKFKVPNTLVGDIDVEDILTIHYKQPILMWAPENLKVLGDTKVIDVEVISKYFVQIMVSDLKIWVCFHSFSSEQNSFVPEKCYRMPAYVQLLPETKIQVMTSDPNFEDSKYLE